MKHIHSVHFLRVKCSRCFGPQTRSRRSRICYQGSSRRGVRPRKRRREEPRRISIRYESIRLGYDTSALYVIYLWHHCDHSWFRTCKYTTSSIRSRVHAIRRMTEHSTKFLKIQGIVQDWRMRTERNAVSQILGSRR